MSLQGIIVVSSTLEPMIWLVTDSWLNNGARYGFILWRGLKSKEKVVGYFHDVHAISEAAGMSSQVHHYCNSKGLELGKIEEYFPPLEVCIVPACTLEASHSV